MRRELEGIGAAKGMALGRARVREPHRLDIEEQLIAPEAVDHERERLQNALQAARDELKTLRDRVRGVMEHEVGEFLDLHAMLLDDPELQQGLDELVRLGRYSAAYALRLQRDRLAAVFDGIDDPYLRSRREDIDHVIGRVYAALQRRPLPQIIGLAGEILVTDNVAPVELAQLSESGVVGIVTASGSALSHAAILARSLHLPMVVGVHEALNHVNDGDTLMLDGVTGKLIVEPDADDLRAYREAERIGEREQRLLSRLRSAPTRTRDGIDIRLFANAESHADVVQAHALGAEGVGLYRTEFLFLQRRELPSEEEQFLVYRDMVLAMAGRPVTIRTLDLGADKADGCGLTLTQEPNPALGLRGVRLCLAHEPLFRTQLRAILRAAAYGPVRVLVPMISDCNELRRVRRLLQQAAGGLREQGYALGEQVELGAMIEVPAAALALGSLVRYVDFFSIGTNDLVQYLLAADRNNDALGPLCSPLHPAVLRVVHDVIAHAKRVGKPVAVCGEVAGDARFTALLLALGLTDFSMHPSNLLEIRRAVRATDHAQVRRQCQKLLRCDREALLRWVDGGVQYREYGH
jgi:phosphoenolpyruvate-protein phosphotransferase (PTS system enzyme I)